MLMRSDVYASTLCAGLCAGVRLAIVLPQASMCQKGSLLSYAVSRICGWGSVCQLYQSLRRIDVLDAMSAGGHTLAAQEAESMRQV